MTIECAAAEKSDRCYAPVNIEGLGALTVRTVYDKSNGMIIDSRVIRASMGNDPKFIREAAADFLSGARTDIANITQAISATDTEEVRAGSHRLKGAAAIFGANDLKHVCAEPSTAVSRGRQDHSEARARRLSSRLSASCLRARIAILRPTARLRVAIYSVAPYGEGRRTICAIDQRRPWLDHARTSQALRRCCMQRDLGMGRT